MRTREVQPAFDSGCHIERQVTDLLRAERPGIFVPGDLDGGFTVFLDAGK